jgi:hypothetical protein
MSDEMSVSLSTKAFIKPLLHALKYAHCAVNGLLLAKDDSMTKDGRSTVVAVDAVPLFHSSLTLAPMMEVALTQIDVYCKNNNLTICGYYQANENLDDNRPLGIACRLGDKIQETCGESFLLMIDNKKLLNLSEETYILYSGIDGKWKKSNKGVTVSTDASEAGNSLVKNKTYRDLVDFDNYLDDITVDWRNSHLDQVMTQI